MREESFHFTESEEKILQAALQVVSEKTISGTRMHLIAEHAGMVQSNVHYYYKTKQELLLGLQERVLEEFYSIRRMDRQRSGDTLEEQIHIFFRQKKHMILEKEAYDFAELNFLVHSKMDEKIRERFRQSYAEWREDIREAAEYVNASHFIEKLPGGYQEPVTERGSTFSAGERQLLSFARTLAHKPSILVMDEATANIDTETELLIQEALEKLMQGRTTIMVAHRLSTIQHADCIMVMHKGKIREQGTHQELLAQDGIYKKLYELQIHHEATA